MAEDKGKVKLFTESRANPAASASLRSDCRHLEEEIRDTIKILLSQHVFIGALNCWACEFQHVEGAEVNAQAVPEKSQYANSGRHLKFGKCRSL